MPYIYIYFRNVYSPCLGHSGHFYVRGVTPSVASKANDGEKSVFTKKGPKYSLGFML